MTRRTHGFGGDRGDLGFDFVPGLRVFPRASVAASSSSFFAALARVVPANPAAWAVVQFRGVREDRAPLGAVDGAAGIEGGQPAEPFPVHDAPAFEAGRASEVRAVRGGHGPDVVHAGGREVREVASVFCPASKTTVMSAASGARPAAAQTASYRAFSWLIMTGNWVTSGGRRGRRARSAGSRRPASRPGRARRAAGPRVSAWPSRAARSAPSRSRSR